MPYRAGVQIVSDSVLPPKAGCDSRDLSMASILTHTQKRRRGCRRPVLTRWRR